MTRKIRLAFVGGGPKSFMGPVHRRASALDGLFEVVAGAFSGRSGFESTREQSKERQYPDCQSLIASELLLPRFERAELIAVLTPNYLHAECVSLAVQNGFAVLCEKPLADRLADAVSAAAAVTRAGAVCAVSYTYLGYPLVHELRERIAIGSIGDVRRVSVSYTQGWLAEPVERENPSTAWRTDRDRAGPSGSFGDIGVHAQSLAEFVSGQRITDVFGDLRAVGPGRVIDDDGAALLRFSGGASGTIVASQVCAGEQNRLEVAVFGSRGSIRWLQERPTEAIVTDHLGVATRISTNPAAMISDVAKSMLRLPAGHGEGYIEALANIYRSLAASIRGQTNERVMPLPGIEDGVRSVRFVDAMVRSSQEKSWQEIEV